MQNNGCSEPPSTRQWAAGRVGGSRSRGPECADRCGAQDRRGRGRARSRGPSWTGTAIHAMQSQALPVGLTPQCETKSPALGSWVTVKFLFIRLISK